MGYWTTSPNGHSFAEGTNPDGTDMLWGDAPADLMDNALDLIIPTFRRDLGRAPTVEELVAGLMFSAQHALDEEQQRRVTNDLYTWAVTSVWSWTDFDGQTTAREEIEYFDATDADDARRLWDIVWERHRELLPDSDMTAEFVKAEQVEPTRRSLTLVSTGTVDTRTPEEN